MSNRFKNRNVLAWYQWIFLRHDPLPAISIYFLSKRNSTSPRFYPLYENSTKLRIVLFTGSRLPYFDRIYLQLLPYFIQIFRKKFSRYRIMFLFGLGKSSSPLTNQVLHFDDPEYTKPELESILAWENKKLLQGFRTAVLCTSDYTGNYLVENKVQSEVLVIPQGHSYPGEIRPRTQKMKKQSAESIKLAYASPYMHSKGDVHAGHINWDITEFFSEIVPELLEIKNLEIHLVGEVGKSARKLLPIDSRIIKHGLVDVATCSEILSSCDIGLYPRKKDNKRQAQKISEYLGAELAVISFRLVDAGLVEKFAAGVLVDNNREFVDAVLNLCDDPLKLRDLQRNARIASTQLRWEQLGKILDRICVS